MKNLNFLLIFSVLFISSHIYALRITTEELEEIYGGPEEGVNYGWSSPSNPTKYDKYHSTGLVLFFLKHQNYKIQSLIIFFFEFLKFIFSPSREQYYNTLIQEEFRAPKFDIIKGNDIIFPHLSGDGIRGYLFDGTSVILFFLPPFFSIFSNSFLNKLKSTGKSYQSFIFTSIVKRMERQLFPSRISNLIFLF